MKNLLVGASLAGALVVIALMAMTAGQNAQAVYLTPDAVAGSVANVSADMDTTGNTTVLGAPGIDPSVGGITIGNTQNVDIVVDEIAAADGSGGYGLNILFDPSIIQITANSFAANFTGCIDFAAGTNPLPTPVGPPGSFSWRTDVGCFPPPSGLAGERVLTRITVKCIAQGTSIIDVNDLVGGDGLPDVFNAGGGLLTGPATAGDGSIGCGQIAALVPDVAVTSVTTKLPDVAPPVNVPDNQAVGVAFPVTADVTLSNVGAANPISVDTNIKLNLPADCTTGATNPVTVLNTSVSVAGSPVSLAPQSWSVTCAAPSNHPFTTTATATVVGAAVAESNLSNNVLTSNGPLSMAAVTATAELALQGVTLSGPVTQAAAGVPFEVTATVTVLNNGPFSPADADVTVNLTLPTGCTTTALNPRTKIKEPVSASTQILFSWTNTICSTPGVYTFLVNTGDASVAPALHVVDGNGGNNRSVAAASVNVPVVNAADLQVTAVTVVVPETKELAADIGTTTFDLTVNASVANFGPFGPVNADVTIGLDIPKDCTAVPAGDQTELAVSLPVVATTDAGTALPTKTWSVTCSQPSFHNFIANVKIGFPAGSTDVVDPTPDKNTRSGDDTTAITAKADLTVVGVTVSKPDSAKVNEPFDVKVDSSVRNKGPFGPADAVVTVSLTMTDGCTRSPDRDQEKRGLSLAVSQTATAVPTMTWSVTCTGTVPDTFKATASIKPENIHVIDADKSSDSAVAGASEAPSSLPSTGSFWLGGDGGPSWVLVIGSLIVGLVALSGGLTLVAKRIRRRTK